MKSSIYFLLLQTTTIVRKQVLLFLIFGLPYYLMAQTLESPTIQQQLALDAGIGISHWQDINFSSLHYQATIPSFGLRYERLKTDKGTFFVHAHFGTDSLQTNVSERFKSAILQGELSIGYLKQLTKIKSPQRLQLGFLWNSAINYVNYDDYSAFSFLINHQIEVAARWQYQLTERHQLGTHLSIPLLASIVRPPYAGLDEQLEELSEQTIRFITSGYLTSLFRYQTVRWQLFYNYRCNQRFSLQLQYRFYWQHLNDTHAYWWTQSYFGASGKVHF